MWKVLVDIFNLFKKKFIEASEDDLILAEAEHKIIAVYKTPADGVKKAFGKLYFQGCVMPVVSGGNGKKNKGYLKAGTYPCYKFIPDNRPKFSYKFLDGWKGFQVPLDVTKTDRTEVVIHFAPNDQTAGCQGIRNKLITDDEAKRYMNTFDHYFKVHTFVECEVRFV